MIHTLEKIQNLFKQPSFSAKEAKRLGVTHNALGWYVKKGVLIQIARGLYCKADSNLVVDMKHEELIRIMAGIPNGVVCLISALDIYELTEEFIRMHTIAISNSSYAKKFPQVKFIRLRDMDTGRTKIKLGDYEIAIFDRERTIIDCFRLLSKETAIKVLKKAWSSKEKIDLKKIDLYSQKIRFDMTPYILSVTT